MFIYFILILISKIYLLFLLVVLVLLISIELCLYLVLYHHPMYHYYFNLPFHYF